jgi:Tol biopolymer transport system component
MPRGRPTVCEWRSAALLDLHTSQISSLPGSEGFFSPRWSPDGRFIAALSIDSQRLVFFDVATSHWTDLLPQGAVAWPSWSSDSRSIMFLAQDEPGRAIRRVTISDRHLESIVDTTGLNQLIGPAGPWLGSAPDGSPTLMLDAGTHDIYALD